MNCRRRANRQWWWRYGSYKWNCEGVEWDQQQQQQKRWEEYKRQTQDVLRATGKPHVFVVKCFCIEGLFCRMLLGNIICVVRWARGVNFPEVFSIRNNYIKVLQINSQSTMVWRSDRTNRFKSTNTLLQFHLKYNF